MEGYIGCADIGVFSFIITLTGGMGVGFLLGWLIKNAIARKVVDEIEDELNELIEVTKNRSNEIL